MIASMRLLLCGCLLAGVLHAVSLEAEVKAVLTRQQEAWNRGNLRAFMQEYWQSPELAFIGKQVARGWQATLERYQKTYPTPAAMGRLTFSEVEVHPLGQDHAWVFGRFHLARTAEGGGDARGRYTLIFTRTKEGWKMVLDHTTNE